MIYIMSNIIKTLLELSAIVIVLVGYILFRYPYFKIIGILITAENKTSKITTSASFFFKYWLSFKCIFRLI